MIGQFVSNTLVLFIHKPTESTKNELHFNAILNDDTEVLLLHDVPISVKKETDQYQYFILVEATFVEQNYLALYQRYDKRFLPSGRFT